MHKFEKPAPTSCTLVFIVCVLAVVTQVIDVGMFILLFILLNCWGNLYVLALTISEYVECWKTISEYSECWKYDRENLER